MDSLLKKLRYFNTLSTIRGFHVYYKIWTPNPTQVYRCAREIGNCHDEFAVAIYHDGEVVGHVPREFSENVSKFLDEESSKLSCKIVGKPYRDGKNGGITELPCIYMFEGLEDNIHNIRKIFEDTMPLEDANMIVNQIGVKGRMQVQRVFLHGPPGAGKSSLLRVILGQDPLKSNEENSTGILQPPERLVTASKLVNTSHHGLKKVGELTILSMIAKELKINGQINDAPSTCSLSSFAQSTTPSNTQQLSSSQIQDNQSNSEAVNRLVNQIGKHLQKSSKIWSVFSILWVHLIDSGGQPQFTELLPLVYPTDKNVCFFVIRLNDHLDQKQYSNIVKKGKKLNCKSSEVFALTLYEMIENFCKTAKLSHSCVQIIGTHLDRVNECNEKLNEKEQKLQKLKEQYEDVLILNEDGNAIYALNAMETDAMKRTQYQDELKRIIVDKKVLCVDEEVPLSWLVLQLLIERESRCGIIAYSDVQKFADKLNIQFDPNEALRFFSELALIFFFPDVLPDVVIDDLGILTCSISQVIFSTIIPNSSKPNSKEQIKFRKHGICSKSLLSTLCNPFFPIKHIFTVDHFLSILKHLKIIYALPDQEDFFFPGILPRTSPSDSSVEPNNGSHPLLLFLKKDAPLPHAFFSATIVSLLSTENIILCNGRKAQQYRDDICLQYCDNNIVVGVVRVINRIYWMEVHFQPTSSNRLYFCSLRSIIEGQAHIVFKHLKLEPAYELGLTCPSKCRHHEDHPCRVSSIESDKIFLQCTLDGRIMSEDISEGAMWFSDKDYSHGETMSQNDDEDGVFHEKVLGKRSSPSQNSKTDGTRKKSALSKKRIVLKKFSNRDYLEEFATSLHTCNQKLISDTVYNDILSGKKILLSELTSILEEEVNRTVLPNHIDTFVSILKEQDNPILKKLADELEREHNS